MNQNILKTLLVISIVGLLLAAFIFVVLAILNKDERMWALLVGFICIILSSLFNNVRIHMK